MSKTPSLNLQSLLSGGENKHIPATVSVMHKGALSSRRRENRQGFTRRYPGVNFFKCLQSKAGKGEGREGKNILVSYESLKLYSMYPKEPTSPSAPLRARLSTRRGRRWGKRAEWDRLITGLRYHAKPLLSTTLWGKQLTGSKWSLPQCHLEHVFRKV